MPHFKTTDEAEAAFYAAFEATDVALMGAVWSDAPSVVCVHPGGDLLRGRTEVLRSWTDILTGAERPEILYRVIQRTGSDGLAVHLVEELIRPSRSREEPNRILATNVYLNTAEGWRMTAHHASLPLMAARSAPAGSEHPTRRMH
jgi:ketosteroid isomerase-like protein